ncbi:MAG: hypothetical protein IK065_02400 [Neisseriaceae bacterium]|nr:hypothetical protein [Neisseriaceae bacterium]
MSHSKHTKRGFSLYIECWNRSAKKYINCCAICGYRGYSPVIEVDGFFDEDGKWFATNKVIYKELTKTLPKLPLDKLGRCECCAKAQGDDFCAV